MGNLLTSLAAANFDTVALPMWPDDPTGVDPDADLTWSYKKCNAITTEVVR